jgi:hypothetical protein
MPELPLYPWIFFSKFFLDKLTSRTIFYQISINIIIIDILEWINESVVSQTFIEPGSSHVHSPFPASLSGAPLLLWLPFQALWLPGSTAPHTASSVWVLIKKVISDGGGACTSLCYLHVQCMLWCFFCPWVWQVPAVGEALSIESSGCPAVLWRNVKKAFCFVGAVYRFRIGGSSGNVVPKDLRSIY